MDSFTKSFFIFGITWIFSLTVEAQESDLWPANSEDIEAALNTSAESVGDEHYASGNLRARGPVKTAGVRKYGSKDHPEGVALPIYQRTGSWTVYYDSSVLLKLSQGGFADGKKNGTWKVFDRHGRVIAEYIFVDDEMKQKLKISADGKRKIVIDQSDGTRWYDRNRIWLFVIGLLPVVFIRPIENVRLWNKIYRTKYVMAGTTFRKGEYNAQFYAMLIFWWLKHPDDTPEIKRQKKNTNIVCLISVGMATALIVIELLFQA